MEKRILVMAIMVLAVIALIVPETYAIPTLQLIDPAFAGLPVVVADNAPGLDSNPANGVVTYIGSVPAVGGGSWSVNVTTGITKPALGNAVTQIKMDLNSVNLTTPGSGGILDIMFSETDFGPIPMPSSYISEIGGTVLNVAGSSLSYDTYLDIGNALFAMTTPITSHGTYGPGAFSGTASGSAGPLPAPFSITQDVQIVHSGTGTSSFNANIYRVPEPSSALLLLGLILGGIGGIGLLKKKEEI
jgi:hypothetical protein